jgi:hypothetical protein
MQDEEKKLRETMAMDRVLSWKSKMIERALDLAVELNESGPDKSAEKVLADADRFLDWLVVESLRMSPALRGVVADEVRDQSE